MMDKKLSAIIVNHNQKEHTDNLLSDIKLQDTTLFDITVVNNGCKQSEKVDYFGVIEYDYNKNLNHIWNEFSDNSSNEYISYLNNDIRITPNFISDTIQVFEDEPKVGIVIHATNNDKYVKQTELDYTVTDKPIYQGWDFTIRKSVYTHIPDELRFFGGDNFLFSSVLNQGMKIGVLCSSPVLHYKERTRNIVKNISNIHNEDSKRYIKYIKDFNIRVIRTINTNISNRFPSIRFIELFLGDKHDG